MKVFQAQDENDYIQITNSWLKEKSQLGDLIHLPAGNTPIPIYKNWESHKFDFLNQLYFQQVDEVITGSQQG
ncbi:MAG TPA: hypothetical protein PLJ21_12610, partial [Pseudobdellovibrionaceae bacterium]|nr:hypothetical protein [Pseudobdellovibrionaceae bacterium]